MIVLNTEAAVSTPGNFYTVSNIQKWKNKHPKMNLVKIVVKLQSLPIKPCESLHSKKKNILETPGTKIDTFASTSIDDNSVHDDFVPNMGNDSDNDEDPMLVEIRNMNWVAFDYVNIPSTKLPTTKDPQIRLD